MKEVFIHAEDMPENCFDCPFSDSQSDFPNWFCNVNNELLEGEFDIERDENCPLKVLEK